jgi:Rrf2 family protein
MNLTCASSYALHAVVFMARQKTDAPIASHKIADALDMPDRFILKVLKHLVDADLLQSIKGPKGGYKLARPANEISVLSIVEEVDGAIDGKRATLEKFHVSDLVSASKQPARRKAKGA